MAAQTITLRLSWSLPRWARLALGATVIAICFGFPRRWLLAVVPRLIAHSGRITVERI